MAQSVTVLLVPQLGTEVTEAEITEWLMADGEPVEAGEPVVNISTTKMAMDLEAPASGRLKIVMEEGEIAKVGDTLAEIS
ncbi:MAG: lipoyl domain-containing protein [Paracoccaceae bacterium]|nr:lipoyl domain-containing protein [Paracoccaceae bacterium]